MDLQVGTLVLNRFEVLDRIGSGGMGAVYRALDKTLNREVVLKILSPTFDAGKSLIRFQNEAKATSRLNHPNIAKVFDFGTMDDGRPYLAIEFIDGQTLSEYIRPDNLLPIPVVIDIFVKICDALQHAHGGGVVHRDIKPGNIMLVQHDGVYSPILLDFGIAKLERDNDGQALTEVGQIIGSPLYMSPEQATSRPVASTTDQYSLGCVLFHALTGSPPFEADSILEIVSQHAQEPAPDLRSKNEEDWPDELERLVAKMLAKDPDERFRNMDECKLALISVIEPVMDIGRKNSIEKPNHEVVAPWFKQEIWISSLVASSVIGLIVLVMSVGRQQESESINKPVTIDSEKQGKLSTDKLEQCIANKDSEFVLTLDYCDKDLKAFEGYRFARIVNLDNNGEAITDEGIRYLKNSSIYRLRAHNTHVSTLDNVSQLKTLRELELSNTRVTDESLAALIKLRMLRLLKVNGTAVSDKCIDILKRIPTLFIVDLRETNVSRAGNIKLRQAMPACHFNCGYEELGKALLSDSQTEARRLMAARQHDRAIPILKSCIREIEKAQGKDSPSLCTFLHELAQSYVPSGKMDTINQLTLRELRIARQYGDLESVIPACNIRAHVYLMEGKIDESLKMRDEMLRVSAQLEGDHSLPYANRLAEVATVYGAFGHFREAEILNRQALEIYREMAKKKDLKSFIYATILINSGNSKLFQGKKDGVNELRNGQELLKDYGITNGGEASSIINLNSGLSMYERSEGHIELALQYRKKAVALARQYGLVDALKMQGAELVLLYKETGRKREAQDMQEELNRLSSAAAPAKRKNDRQ